MGRWEQWYERLASRRVRKRPVLVSFLLPEHRTNEYSVGECKREFEARGYLLENHEYVKGSISIGGGTVPRTLLQLSFSRVEPADAPKSSEWTRRQARALKRHERRCRRVAARKTKSRPIEAQLRIRVGRKEQSKATIARREQLAVDAFEQRGYRLRSRVIRGIGGFTLNPDGVIVQRSAIVLTFDRTDRNAKANCARGRA